ncbi:MAG: response regulator [Spirochaetia bacterium]|nr:response regulator [Spirochaetia bacterium]
MKNKILIIDDDEDIADNIQALLSFEGFEVIKSFHVDEGIKKIEDEKPDLVLLDIMFPEGKTLGFEAAIEIKKVRPKLPIFAFSAINRDYAFDFQKEDAHVEEFIVKPIDSKNLVNLINKYLK